MNINNIETKLKEILQNINNKNFKNALSILNDSSIILSLFLILAATEEIF